MSKSTEQILREEADFFRKSAYKFFDVEFSSQPTSINKKGNGNIIS